MPHMIIKGLAGEPLPVYGDGKNIRDWLYVEDHAKALTLVLEAGWSARPTMSADATSAPTCMWWRPFATFLEGLSPSAAGARRRLISFVADRPGDDKRYAIDASKLERDWSGALKENFESGTPKTVQWYLNQEPWWCAILARGCTAGRLGLGHAAASGNRKAAP